MKAFFKILVVLLIGSILIFGVCESGGHFLMECGEHISSEFHGMEGIAVVGIFQSLFEMAPRAAAIKTTQNLQMKASIAYQSGKFDEADEDVKNAMKFLPILQGRENPEDKKNSK